MTLSLFTYFFLAFAAGLVVSLATGIRRAAVPALLGLVCVALFIKWMGWFTPEESLGLSLAVLLVVVSVGVTLRDLEVAEVGLRATVARYRAILDTAVDGIIVIDARGRIELINPAAERLFGYSTEELRGRNVNVLMPEPDHTQHDGYLERYLSTGEKKIIGIGREVRGKRRDGKLFPMDLSVGEVRLQGEVFFVGLIHDISARKEAEEQLAAQARELARSNRDLQQFAYVASHDLQEPLRMVGSYVQLLAKRYRDKLDADANEFIDYAVGGARRMQELINDLLTYSRVGTRTRPFEPVDLNQVLLKVKHNLKLSLDDTGGTIIAPELPSVVADETQMMQLFQNLLGNALKFRSERPPEIRIEPIRDDYRPGWIFRVIDNGMGFEPRFAERIFTIFQRLHTIDQFEGSGIGLSICKRIVERHGGEIRAESEPGVGSTFIFRLPDAPDVAGN